MQNPTFEEWRNSEENDWKNQDEHTQRMMFTMMYRGYESK